MPQGLEDLEVLGEAISSYRKSAAGSLGNLTRNANALEASLEALKEKVDGAIGEIVAERARVDGIATDFQGQFSAAQETRLNEHADLLVDLRQRFDEFWEGIKSEATASRVEIIDDLKRHQRDAQALVHVIGNTGMVGGYQVTANYEKSAYRFWQGVAALGMVAVVGLTSFLLTPAIGGALSWESVLARIAISASPGILAAWAARQADKHHSAEQYNRRMELELPVQARNGRRSDTALRRADLSRGLHRSTRSMDDQTR